MDLFSNESTDQKDRFCSGYRPRERILRIIDASNEQQSRTTTSTTSTTTCQRWGKFYFQKKNLTLITVPFYFT